MPCAFQLNDPRTGCQFSVPEDDLIAVAGPNGPQKWCKFHLPLMADSREEASKAEWGPASVAEFNKAVHAHIGAARNENRLVDLSGVVFPPGIGFRDSRGRMMNLPEVSFLQGIFGGDITFRNATFSGDANFSGVTFFGRADFRGVTFQRNAFFESAGFVGITEFRGATFGRAAKFKKARFNDTTTFHKARFGFLVEFDQTKFLKGVTFEEAFFGGEINFERAEFDGHAKFFGDPSSEGATGPRNIFPRSVKFRDARFKRRAMFTNRRFQDNTDFRNAVFQVAPEFYDCTLHQGTSFAGAQFLDRSGTQEVDAASAYRTLKLKMAGMRATDEEALFYSLEQRSLRANGDTPTSVKVVSWLYEHTADYGRSFLRPLVWLGGTFVAFALVYLAALTGKMVTWADVEAVLYFGLQQVFQPFYIFRTGKAVSGHEVPLWLAFMAAAHSISTFSFLALFLLALRRRFRLH